MYGFVMCQLPQYKGVGSRQPFVSVRWSLGRVHSLCRESQLQCGAILWYIALNNCGFQCSGLNILVYFPCSQFRDPTVLMATIFCVSATVVVQLLGTSLQSFFSIISSLFIFFITCQLKIGLRLMFQGLFFEKQYILFSFDQAFFFHNKFKPFFVCAQCTLVSGTVKAFICSMSPHKCVVIQCKP